MSSEPQQSKDTSQEEERFWLDFDRQYFAPPHPSLLMCLKNHIWHSKHISSKIGSYLSSKKNVKKGAKRRHNLNLRTVKFPLRLLGVDKTNANDGIFKYFSAASYSNDQIQVLLENDNVYKPLVSAKHDTNQRLPTIYSSPLPDAIHLTLYIPPTNPKAKSETNNTNSEPVVKNHNDDESFNFVDAFGSVQLLENDQVPQIICGPNPTWFTKGRGRFKRGLELGPRYKKCDKLVKNPHGLLSDPVWQHFNTNYISNPNTNFFTLPAATASSRKSDDDSEFGDGTDLLNYHSMCELGSCRVDYSPLLFTFVASKKSLLCKRCLGFPRISCNLCKSISGNSTAMFSSQYISDERYHMVYNLVDLFKLRSTTNDTIPSYYLNPYRSSRDHQTYAITKGEEPEGKEDEDEMQLVHNYVQTLESLNSVFSSLLDRIVNEYKPDTSRWHDIESKMLQHYIELYNNKTLDNRYTYSVQRQSVDVLQLRLKVLKSSELPGTWTDRALCSICGTDDDWDDDPILFCDCCYIPMHFCCLGYKPGTLSDVKQKLMMNKFQRMNYFNYLINNPDKPAKKFKLERMESLTDMDDDEWYCPVCNYLMEQLSFLDENLVMAIIRTVGGPKNLEQLKLLIQHNSGNANENEAKEQQDADSKPKRQKLDPNFKYNLPYVLGFDYDNPLERVYISVHPTKAITNTTRVFPENNPNHSTDTGINLERISVVNLYDYRNESISYNTNCVMDPRNFCKLLLSKKGLYFEHSFWTLLNTCNLASIQEYLNYYSMEDLYLARLVQQDKLIQSVKHYTKKRTTSMNSKLSSRTLSVNSDKEYPQVKKEQENHAKEAEPKKEESRYDYNSTMNCKNPLKKLYVSINLRYLSNLPSATVFSKAAPNLNANVMGKEFRKEDDDVDVVIKLPVCVFCGFDAYFPGGGPMKRTSNNGTWGHIKCALANDCTIEPEEINYSTFVPKIKALKCIFCNNYSTSSIQCSYGNCCKAFHVPCSSASPSCLFTWDTNGKPDVLCPVHSKGLAPTSLLRKLQLRLMNAKDGKDRDFRDPGSEREQRKGKFGKYFVKAKVKEKDKEKNQEDADKSKEKETAKNVVKGTRDVLDTVSINENLYLNHFLRPNYSNLTKLLELMLNEKIGTIFQSNLSSNCYNKDALMRTTSTVSVNSTGLTSLSSVSSNVTSNSKSTNQDDLSSNDDMYKVSDREDDDYVPSITPKSTNTVRDGSLTPSNVTPNEYKNKDDVAMELDETGDEVLLLKNESILKDASNILLGKEQLLNKHKGAVEGRCPLNNIDANNCFWCCLGLDLSYHNRHVFDDKTPSSRSVLSILYNNNLHNVDVIKTIINSKYDNTYESQKEEDDGLANQPSKKSKKKETAKEKEDSSDRELKIPWNMLSSIIMDNVVDEKINIYINNDLINNTKLIKKNDSVIQKISSEALVRLFNTFEPDSTRYVVRTLFSLLKHIEFINGLDELYGYNSIYYYSSSGMDSPRVLDSKNGLNIPNLNLNENFAGANLNLGNLLGNTKNLSFSRKEKNENSSSKEKNEVKDAKEKSKDRSNGVESDRSSSSKDTDKSVNSKSSDKPNLKEVKTNKAKENEMNGLREADRSSNSSRSSSSASKGSKASWKVKENHDTNDKVKASTEEPKSEASPADAKDGKSKADEDKAENEKKSARQEVYKLLKEVNNVEIIKLDKALLPSSILRKYVENKKITICKVCLEFKYIENDIDVNKRKRNIYNESYRKCKCCNVEVCNSCLTVARHDFENLTINTSLIVGDYIGEEIDDFYFLCIRCKDLTMSNSIPLLNCALCSRYDGLMLKVNPKHLTFIPCKTSLWNNYCYVHLICLEWLFWSKNINNNMRKVNRSQFEQNCNYCGLLTGATVTCSNSACYSKFHASCAAFLGCKIDVGKKSENIVGAKRALCLRHTLISICRTSAAERKFMVAPCYLYEVLVNTNYFATFFKAVYLSPNCINNKPKLTSRFKIKKRSKSLDYKNSLSMMKMASYINYGLITNKSPQVYEVTITESVARNRLIQGMNYVFYQKASINAANLFNGKDPDPSDCNMREIKNIINLVRNGILKPIQGSKRGRKPKSLDGSDSDKRHKMPMEDILKYGHRGVLENGEYYCPICFSIYFENSPGLPGDDLHWIGCDKCERWFHFVCAGVWVDYRDKDSWFCYHCDNS
ncbi:uncharacterized protein TOT_030000118 [Theileria orientalis strain Shintoku]|uniref:PHD-type domain-containing protein n=1 Tax=Theileria orientalis strain Shintoku TaxID=869250 RepID=J4C3Q6_THEOR|nr:uncharacterized protein TOT_030000118 [Theileria orientalis strain Shintoku]BAM40856.1 uncharacterized protein TOT_030000118 [Theileria orientalis strain Shintoku]|eukprot:XP_009691157.1 uncharacterized protein TOT_030000118 [Theileria orientalis strain Shintoku]